MGRSRLASTRHRSLFYQHNQYNLGYKTKQTEIINAAALGSLYHRLLDRYPIVLLEDPFAQDDWDAFSEFTKTCSVEIVGDDLLATNINRVRTAIQKKACNSMLLKVNQIGTVTEAIAAAQEAYSAGWSVFVSHRSGETTDNFIADLTVGLRTGHLKSGAPARGERVAKYNRLMDIEENLRLRNQSYYYAGEMFRYAHERSMS